MTKTFEMRTVKNEKGADVKRPFNITSQKMYSSKSQAAGVIFKEVNAEDYDLNGLTVRGEFLRRVNDELELSTAGGATYYNNEQRAARGQDRYQFNKASNKRAIERKRAEKESAKEQEEEEAKADDQPAAEEPAVNGTEADVEVHRWQVVNKDTRELVESFTSRAKAQEYNRKQNGNTVMIDGEKQSA